MAFGVDHIDLYASTKATALEHATLDHGVAAESIEHVTDVTVDLGSADRVWRIFYRPADAA